jgi:hypothetical protein
MLFYKCNACIAVLHFKDILKDLAYDDIEE